MGDKNIYDVVISASCKSDWPLLQYGLLNFSSSFFGIPTLLDTLLCMQPLICRKHYYIESTDWNYFKGSFWKGVERTIDLIRSNGYWFEPPGIKTNVLSTNSSILLDIPISIYPALSLIRALLKFSLTKSKV